MRINESMFFPDQLVLYYLLAFASVAQNLTHRGAKNTKTQPDALRRTKTPRRDVTHRDARRYQDSILRTGTHEDTKTQSYASRLRNFRHRPNRDLMHRDARRHQHATLLVEAHLDAETPTYAPRRA